MALEIFKLVGSILVDNEEANKSIRKTDEEAQGLGKTFLSAADKAGKWAVGIATAATTAAVAIGVDAVNAASDFEDSFAKVNTLLSDTTNIDEYKQSILDLSNETGVATSEISEAVYSAISAGVDEAKAVEFTAQAMKLAEGGFTDAATAVDVMTTAINAYGLSAEDAAQVSDYLITTQNLGKTTVNELASSLGKVIPIASAYGVEMDDLSTNMAILTKNGIATAEATTYTKSMLNELGDSGSKVSKILKDKTGKTFAELEGEGYSLGDVIEVLGESVDGNTTAFNELWSSSEAGVGALTLLNAGADEYNSTLEEMRSSAGATDDAFNTMHNTLSTSIETFKTNIDNMMVSLGEELLPIIQEVMDFILENMPMVQDLVMQLAPTIGDLFTSLIPPLLELAQSLLPPLVDLINQIMPIVVDLMSTVLPVIVDLIGQLAPFLAQLLQTMLPLIETVLTPLIPLLTPLSELLAPILELIMALIEPLVNLLNMVLPPLLEILSAFIAVMAEDLAICIEAAAIWINETLVPAFQAAWDKVVAVKDGILEGWQSISDGIGGFVDGIKTKVQTGFDALVDIVKTPINTVIGFINKLIDGLNSLEIDVPDWVTDMTGIDDFSLNIPKIPELAKGGSIDLGGSAIVGEAGAELVDLPAGAKVTPLSRSNGEGGSVEDKIDAMVGLLQELIEIMPDAVAEGVSKLDFRWNNRELGRLVKQYE